MPQAAVAEKAVEKPIEKPEIVIPPEAIRRFEVPDLERYAHWLMPRLLAQFKHLNERQMIGFLRDMAYSNEHYFLVHEHAVGLFQAMGSHALQPDPVIWERFVWAQDAGDPEHIAACAEMYARVARWAKQKGIKVLHVEESTDVPHAEIEKRLGRISEIKQKVARF